MRFSKILKAPPALALILFLVFAWYRIKRFRPWLVTRTGEDPCDPPDKKD